VQYLKITGQEGSSARPVVFEPEVWCSLSF